MLRIKLRYDDVETLIQRFASNVGKSGLFLPTKAIQPIGTEVKFELRLASDVAVLVGLGRVKHVKPHDPARPKATFGMAIELTRVSREGRELIIKMLERRRALGLPEVAIPVPDDAERRTTDDSSPRAETSGIVREAMRDFASAPVAEQVLAPRPPIDAPVTPPGDAIGVARTAPPDEPSPPVAASEPDAAPVVIAPVASRPVPALPPERERRARRRPDDLLAAANELAGRLEGVAVPELDVPVDFARALERARALAGSDLEGELAALRESSAAPTEISIEAASAELARQLGGKPIGRRERSARWSAPLSTPVATPISMASAAVSVDAPAPPAPPPVEAPVEVRAESSGPVGPSVAADDGDEDPAREYATDAKTRVPVGDGLVYLPPPAPAEEPADDLEVPQEHGFANVSEDQLRTVPGDIAEPDRRAYESSPALALDDSDLEQVDENELVGESTHVGATPAGLRALASTGLAEPIADDAAARLDRELEQAEAEADDELREMQAPEPGGSPYIIAPYTGESQYLDSEPVPLVEPVRPSVPISDLDVLSEADAHEADLLGARAEPVFAEANATLGEAPAFVDPDDGDPAFGGTTFDAPTADDFADRLALDDDELDREEARNFPTANPRPRARAIPDLEAALADRPSSESIDVALDERPSAQSMDIALDDLDEASRAADVPNTAFLDAASESYTFAEAFPNTGVQFAPHTAGEDFDEPHGFTLNTPAPPSPRAKAEPEFERHVRAPGPDDDAVARALRSFDEPSQPDGRAVSDVAATGDDLDDALSALAPDIDPRASVPAQAPRSSSKSRPLPGLPPETPARGTPTAPEPRVAKPSAKSRSSAPKVTVPAKATEAKPATAPRSRVGANVIQRAPKGGTAPPPIPAAARKPATIAPPTPPKAADKPASRRSKPRMQSDDGILIDFDDDE